MGKAFCERPFALHRQQPEHDERNVDVVPPGKISADARAKNSTLVPSQAWASAGSAKRAFSSL